MQNIPVDVLIAQADPADRPILRRAVERALLQKRRVRMVNGVYRTQRKRHTYNGLPELISCGIGNWCYTPEGWRFWRDMHNKYAPIAHKYTGVYEPDDFPSDVEIASWFVPQILTIKQ